MRELPKWLSQAEPQFVALFQASVAYVERRPPAPAPILAAIAQQPDSALLQKEFAQYFTPPDVALYAAYQLIRVWHPGLVCFDPAMGKGSLLIACGVTLALTKGLRDEALLAALGGRELCPATRAAAIANVQSALAPWLTDLAPSEAAAMLNQNLRQADFLTTQVPTNALVISNPPYQEAEGGAGNLWIKFAERILASPDLVCLALIVPVSLCCAKRTQPIRQTLLTRFRQLSALHHEIRPRPLFPKIEQRISILIATNAEREPQQYETTGFITHCAGDRASVWTQPFTSLPYEAVQNCFPKVAPQDVPFFWQQLTAASRLQAFASERPEDTLWVRSTGRYKLLAQPTRPAELTTKWHAVRLLELGRQLLLTAFENGAALRWWRIFGDGRDLSIRQFVQRFGV